MSSNPGLRHPLLNDRKTSETCFDDSGEPKLSTLADHLGITEIDALHDFSSSRSSAGDRKSHQKGRESPTVVLTQEQVNNLIQTLENTGNALKQLTYRGSEVAPHRRPRIPRWIISHLLMITALWQITGTLALAILKGFTAHRKDERSTFILTIAILVVIQAVNLLLVFVTSVKLTKQFLHQTVTKSFLAQSYLSMTLLYAGLYTLVYNIKHEAFEESTDGLKIGDSAFSSFVLFSNMLYYSISTATLCGTGHIIASTWYAQLISASQMLMSYVYFASVLTIAVHPPKKIQYTIGKHRDRNINSTRSYGSIRNV
ncbi:uncharacterized protein LOC116302704 [Actinia tenebrosa]|uniref:Uncharacterized protein LOC116302704 n=1 Tax=Actinia tenebrosa TaxID=6105 RepID=A0A6P8ILS1_ACTTE|nr:uncharacterized protein LOC116302704 [Actinia tenebrosa]